ncbi:MAG: MFS transporter, partial [Chthonomonadales bacterium]
MEQAVRNIINPRIPGLSLETEAAWRWDMLTGACAGVYQGCIWTFVARVARAELHAADSQMAWIAAAPALGYVFATVWARQMDGRSKMPFIYWTWLIARGFFLFAPFVKTTPQFIFLVCLTPFVFSVSTPAYTAVMKEIYPDRQRGRLMSSVRMLMAAVMLITALIIGRLLDMGVLHWQSAFFIGGIFGTASAIAFSRIKLPVVPESDEPRIS